MKFKKVYNTKELIIILFSFLSILYSTSFHYSNSPPNDTFEPGQFFVETSAEDGGDLIVDKYFSDYSLFYKHFFKDGKWTNDFHPRIMTGWNDMWKSTAMSKDNAYYILYAAYYGGLIDKIDYSVEGANSSMSVHKYRVLLPMIVGTISKISKLSKKSKYEWSEKYISRIVYIYITLNFLFLLVTSFLFMFFLVNVFSFGKYLSFFGSILFLTLPIVTKSAGFPQAEPISLLTTLLIFISVYYRKSILFIIFSALGLMIKDLFIYVVVLWFFNYSFSSIKNIKKTFLHIITSIIPILIFISIRIYFSDGSGLETRGSYDLLKGELPPWTVFGSPYYYLEKLFLVFTFLWIGIINLNKNAFLMKSSLTMLFITFISLWIARGSGIERHVGMMFPIIIPLFLYFFYKKDLKFNK